MIYLFAAGAPEIERVLFKEEFDIMTKIGYHPNVVNILGSCDHEGKDILCFEFDTKLKLSKRET